ncbi:unnamed protein product [Effrenium voratum]|nr:unnamed protein product [Effrenium voratum]
MSLCILLVQLEQGMVPESISMMRRFSRTISPDEMDEHLRTPTPAGRRTVITREHALEAIRRDSRDKRIANRQALMEELDGLLDSLKKDPSEEGFSNSEVNRLYSGFKRFMIPGTIDVHKDDICELLTFLGCVFLDQAEIRSMMDKTTQYEHMGFDDFQHFMGRYAQYCQSQYRVIFDRFDEDESGTISMEELRQMTHYLGFMPTRVMLEEAVEVVCRSRKRSLSFDELVLFLMVYRRREGFCREEVEELRKIHAMHSREQAMPVSKVSVAMMQAFGRQVTSFADKFQDQLQKGLILRSTQISPDPDFEPEKLPFSEFLILCRSCREELHCQLDSLWPPSHVRWSAPVSREDRGLATRCNPHGEGHISDEELREVLRSLGYIPLTKAMLDIYNQVIGVPIPQDLDYDEFFDFVWRFRKQCGFSSDELVDIRDFYVQHDEDGSGEICTLELGTIFRSLGYKATTEDLSGLLLDVDQDQSGFLNFEEFVILMGDFRTLELRKIHDAFSQFAVDGYLQESQIEMACKRLGRHLIDMNHQPEEDDEFDFEDFVDWVDECRHDCMMRDRKLAGFGYWKVECLREAFGEFDKNGNGCLEPDELIRLLRYLDVSEAPKTKAEQRAMIKLVEVARKHAYDAGVREAYFEQHNNITFWTFVQLLRLLQTQKEKREGARLNKLMEQLRFSKFEVEQFRQIFVHWAKCNESAERDDKEIDTETHLLTEEQVCRIFRSAGVSLVGRMRELLVGLEPLQSEHRRLSFHNFLRLMRWVIDNDFAGLGGQVSAMK